MKIYFYRKSWLVWYYSWLKASATDEKNLLARSDGQLLPRRMDRDSLTNIIYREKSGVGPKGSPNS